MIRKQSKITKHTKKKKNVTNTQKKSQLLETNPKMNQVLELADKDFKGKNTPVTNKIENFNREIEIITKIQMEILKTKKANI